MSACQHLKEATASHHRLAERALINRELFSKALSPARYADCLARYLGLVAPLEQQLARYQEPIVSGYSLRAHLLHADLLALGWPEQRINAIAPCDRLPAMNTAAAALGTAYILQGSRLGGAVIRRRVLAILGEESLQAGGLGFFGDTDGAETARLWQAFKSSVDAWFIAPHDLPLEQATLCAMQTFDAFQYWLNRPLS